MKSSEERENAIKQLILDLKANKQLYEDMKLEIERFIFDNPDLTLEEQTILRLKYIENWSYEKIGSELGYDKSVISRKVDSVLDRFKTGMSREISSSLREFATHATF